MPGQLLHIAVVVAPGARRWSTATMVLLLWLVSAFGLSAQTAAPFMYDLPRYPTSAHTLELERHLAIPGLDSLAKLPTRAEVTWSQITGLRRAGANQSRYRWPLVRKILRLGRKTLLDETLPRPRGRWAGEVYGILPYWMGEAWQDYPLEKFDRILHYAYAVDPATGRDRNPLPTWSTSLLQDSVHSLERKVDLVVALYGDARIRQFLRTDRARRNLTDTLVKLLPGRGDGIVLDFQTGRADSVLRDSLTGYVVQLFSALQNADPTYTLSLTLPCGALAGSFDFAALETRIHRYFYTGYDFYLNANTGLGPASVLGSNAKDSLSLLGDLARYEAAGMPREKLVVLQPWYGKEYITPQKMSGTAIADQFALLPLSHFKRKYPNGGKRDPQSKSRYAVKKDTTGDNRWIQAWWDDEVSLLTKFTVFRRRRVAGVGIYGLGYDQDFTPDPMVVEAIIIAASPPPDTSVVVVVPAKDSTREKIPGLDEREAAPYREAGGPTGYVTEPGPNAAKFFYWVTPDPFEPEFPNTDAAMLMQSPDIPMPLPPNLRSMGYWGGVILGYFLLLGLIIPLSRFGVRILIFVHKPWLGFIYLPGLVLLALVLASAVSGRVLWIVDLILLGLSFVATAIVEREMRDVQRPVDLLPNT
ncbi:MAG: glycoside hydrolase family 18 protein [Bacteroidota bacterium]